jgi:hypothetical protein
MNSRTLKRLAYTLLALAALAGCTAPTPTSTRVFTLPELKYKLFAEFDVFWVNPHLWPIVREGEEQQEALARFAVIRADETEFQAILAYLSLSFKESYTDEEKLLIFRQHQKLALAMEMTTSGSGYTFVLREGEGDGWRYEGTISTAGEIRITKKEPSLNIYPICLTLGTLIDTPSGRVPVENLAPGMLVWSVDESGRPMAVPILKTSRTGIPQDFKVITILLADGRSVSASPRHPSAAGIALAEYRVGDELDGSAILSIAYSPYPDGFTFDLLPGGKTGCYRANGILLKSTLTE